MSIRCRFLVCGSVTFQSQSAWGSRHPRAPSSACTATTLRKRGTFAALGLLGVAALLAYHNSLNGPFTFADQPSIEDSSAIGL